MQIVLAAEIPRGTGSSSSTTYGFSISSGSHITFGPKLDQGTSTASTNGIVQSQQYTRESIGNICATGFSNALTTKGIATETIGGALQDKNAVFLKVYDDKISGGSQEFFSQVDAKTSTFASLANDLKTHIINNLARIGVTAFANNPTNVGDSLPSIASTLESAIDASLFGIGISASTSGSSVVITSTSVNATTYSQSTSSGAAITISFSGGPSENAAGGAAPIGAGRLKTVTNDVISNSTTSYSFDAIGRPINRSINSTVNSTDLSYDGIDRLVSETNALGTFNYFYINDSTGASKGDGRLASITYPNGQSAVFSYFPNNADQRLREIKNLDPNSNVLSQFNHSYNAAGEMIQWLQQQKSQHLNLSLAYDLASQLSSVKAGIGTAAPPFGGQSYFNYDCAANRAGVQQSQIQNARIGGTPTVTDQITLTVKDSALSGGQKNIVYTVGALDTTTASIASGLAAAVCADTDMQTIGMNATASSSLVTLKSESANITSYSTGWA